jgi:DNA-binding LacI/PurR family transcriptional regulator
MANGGAKLSDVARKAGVSLTAASGVLRGAAVRISPETRRRIEEAARELRYQPNAVARGLVRGRTNIVGFYMGHELPIDDPFFVEIHCGLEAGCQANGQHLLIYGNLGVGSLDEAYAELMSGLASALVLYAVPDDPLVARLSESHLPLVAIADPIPGLSSVVADDAGGARLQAEHLAEKGHRRILYRNTPEQFVALVRQFEGFTAAAADLGLTVTETMPPTRGQLTPVEEIALALPPGERPTAAVCWSDSDAYALLDTCRTRGIRVPEDLAIVGYDGFRVAFAKTSWELTTVRVPWRAIAAKAVSLLVDSLDGGAPPAETALPAQLVAGKTT